MLFKGPLLHKVWDLVVFLCPIGQYWLGWLFFFSLFFCPCKHCRRVWVFLPLFISSMLYFFLFFKKSCISCFSEALFTCDEDLMSLKVWALTLSDVLLEGGGGEFCQDGRLYKIVILFWIVCDMSCVCLCLCVHEQYSEDGNTLQFTNRLGPYRVLPLPLAFCLSSVFSSQHLLLTVILNSLNLPFQHAQSKDIFPHLCIVSEVSGVHFLWYTLYYSDGKWVHIMDL